MQKLNIYEATPWVASYQCCIVIYTFISFGLILVSVFNQSILMDSAPQFYSDWNNKFIEDLQISESCEKGYINMLNFTWPGTELGCDCIINLQVIYDFKNNYIYINFSIQQFIHNYFNFFNSYIIINLIQELYNNKLKINYFVFIIQNRMEQESTNIQIIIIWNAASLCQLRIANQLNQYMNINSSIGLYKIKLLLKLINCVQNRALIQQLKHFKLIRLAGDSKNVVMFTKFYLMNLVQLAILLYPQIQLDRPLELLGCIQRFREFRKMKYHQQNLQQDLVYKIVILLQQNIYLLQRFQQFNQNKKLLLFIQRIQNIIKYTILDSICYSISEIQQFQYLDKMINYHCYDDDERYVRVTNNMSYNDLLLVNEIQGEYNHLYKNTIGEELRNVNLFYKNLTQFYYNSSQLCQSEDLKFIYNLNSYIKDNVMDVQLTAQVIVGIQAGIFGFLIPLVSAISLVGCNFKYASLNRKGSHYRDLFGFWLGVKLISETLCTIILAADMGYQQSMMNHFYDFINADCSDKFSLQEMSDFYNKYEVKVYNYVLLNFILCIITNIIDIYFTYLMCRDKNNQGIFVKNGDSHLKNVTSTHPDELLNRTKGQPQSETKQQQRENQQKRHFDDVEIPGDDMPKPHKPEN